jgi:hypothetical protein
MFCIFGVEVVLCRPLCAWKFGVAPRFLENSWTLALLHDTKENILKTFILLSSLRVREKFHSLVKWYKVMVLCNL